MSVPPSAALTQNRSGGVQPVAVSLLMSARSSSTSTRPDQSRTVVTGGVSTVDAESMKYSMVSGMVTMWSRRHEQRLGLRADPRALGDVQHDQLGLRHVLVPGVGVPLGAQHRGAAAGGPGPPQGGLAARALLSPIAD